MSFLIVETKPNGSSFKINKNGYISLTSKSTAASWACSHGGQKQEVVDVLWEGGDLTEHLPRSPPRRPAGDPFRGSCRDTRSCWKWVSKSVSKPETFSCVKVTSNSGSTFTVETTVRFIGQLLKTGSSGANCGRGRAESLLLRGRSSPLPAGTLLMSLREKEAAADQFIEHKLNTIVHFRQDQRMTFRAEDMNKDKTDCYVSI